jgi:predicted  nucleic acid-binding Zn-ribbon protein
MSTADIAEVTIKINALEQEIAACKNQLENAGRTDLQIVLNQQLTALNQQLTALNQQLTALINERSVLRQQLQASAGKFLFIYFPLGYLN